MKHGKLFFYNMGKITTAARIAIPLSFLMLLRVVPMSPAFWFFIFLMGTSFLVALIHAPSDKAMMQVLERHRAEMKVKMKELCQIKDDQYYVVLDGYRKEGSMKLCRRIGTEVVYPYPTTFIIAQKDAKRRLVIVRKSLLSPTPAEYELIDLSGPIEAEGVRVSSCVDAENDKVAEITLFTRRYPNGITVFAKNDYHYRDFVKAIQDLPK